MVSRGARELGDPFPLRGSDDIIGYQMEVMRDD